MFKSLIFLIFLPTFIFAHPMSILKQAYHNKGKNYTPRTQHIDKQGRAKFVNHLILEASPYLLQHAHNPVNWYSFSEETFNQASQANKPIFISIGYATCHWCHVMEEESFDDVEVAALLNAHFVAIKVDREIRPDVDATYMNVAQLINGSGGWPLNAIILPNGKAFFAGTYFPKPQLLKILAQVHNLWQTEPNTLIKQADEINTVLRSANTTVQAKLDDAIASKAINDILNNFDELEGGFGQAPKFPHESILLLLIDAQKRQPSDAKLNAIITTLDMMASGGFFDVVGGGFHRYSTDNAWLIPHFEKMLYNQAQLALVYTRAYQITQKPLYKRIAQQTLDYVLKEMQAPEGGFFSATDADSEGAEGTFFVWSIATLKRILDKDEFQSFEQWFDLSAHTDFEDSHVIHFKQVNQLKVADEAKVDVLLNKLYNARIQRKPPLTDYKVLLSWNALMIPSLLEAGVVFNNAQYTQAGIALANHLHSFHQYGQLYRVSINGKLETLALFEDYAYLIDAYLAIFDQTGEKIWLDRVIQLALTMNEKFWDKTEFGFNMTHQSKYLNNQHKESYDGAIPSANALAYQALIKLANRTTEVKFAQQAQQLLSAFANQINQNPYNYSSFILGFNQAEHAELSNVQYAYNGRIRIQTTQLKNHEVLLRLTLKPHWHINANQPLQKSLIATEVNNADPENWHIKKALYPTGELTKLGFSEEKISVYQGKVDIKLSLTKTSENYVPPTLTLALQACSDKVCLPPTAVTLKP